jgi:hypothetical protein
VRIYSDDLTTIDYDFFFQNIGFDQTWERPEKKAIDREMVYIYGRSFFLAGHSLWSCYKMGAAKMYECGECGLGFRVLVLFSV